jgi:hypothetical protein
MGVPALCYGIQNALFFVALSNLSASSYQLWSQSKTLFTALFFVNMLGQVRVRCEYGAGAVWVRCRCDVSTVRVRCRCGVSTVQVRCKCG